MKRPSVVQIEFAVVIVLQLVTLAVAIAAYSEASAASGEVGWIGESVRRVCQTLKADPCP